MSIKVKDADGLDKYYQTVEDGSLVNPFQSVVPSYRVAHAEESIRLTYGDTVSVWQKAKSLIKFGSNKDLDTGVSETIWSTGGNETLKTANEIDVVVSTSASDTQTITIEGHTISGTDLTFVTQDLTLNGTTPVSLTTPLARVNRLFNSSATNFVGDITVEDSGTSTNLTILGTEGDNQSKKCQTAISKDDYFIVTQISGGVVGTIAASINFSFQFAEVGKVWRTIREFSSANYTEVPLDPPIIIRKNTDIRIIATSDTNNTEAVAELSGYLAKII